MRFRWRTTACCSSMNCRILIAVCWSDCANHWRIRSNHSRAAMSLHFRVIHACGRHEPMPCGFWNDPTRECRVPSPDPALRGPISGPLLDRIDIHIDVPAVKFRSWWGRSSRSESSAVIRERVISARARQHHRFSGQVFFQRGYDPRLIREHCARWGRRGHAGARHDPPGFVSAGL